jgi:HPt (histidine-containing phosphotransfer) domain-containing protein
MTTPASDPIDATAFANLLAMTGGEIEFVDELVDTYLDDGAAQVGSLRAAASGGDIETLTRAAHSLKSGSLNVGALELGELCRALEEVGRTGTVDDGAARVTAIAAAFDVAKRALLAERERRAPG